MRDKSQPERREAAEQGASQGRVQTRAEAGRASRPGPWAARQRLGPAEV